MVNVDGRRKRHNSQGEVGYSNVEVGGASQAYEMTFKNKTKIEMTDENEPTHGQDITILK